MTTVWGGTEYGRWFGKHVMEAALKQETFDVTEARLRRSKGWRLYFMVDLMELVYCMLRIPLHLAILVSNLATVIMFCMTIVWAILFSLLCFFALLSTTCPYVLVPRSERYVCSARMRFNITDDTRAILHEIDAFMYVATDSLVVMSDFCTNLEAYSGWFKIN